MRALSDALIDEFLSTAARFIANAKIVYFPEFESALVKLEQGNANKLSNEELRSIMPLLLWEGTGGREDCAGMNFAERALKRQRLTQVDDFSRYMDSQFILPTSNICEHLFSIVGIALNNRRASILPENLESQIFLHVNRDVWGIQDFSMLNV